MIYRATYFEGSTLLGQGWHRSKNSELFICPTCGNNWAQILIEEEGSEFFPQRRHCPEHWDRGGFGYPGGMFFSPYDWDRRNDPHWGRTYPNEVLLRDFLFIYDKTNHVDP